jgi:hypothetical protein
MIKDHLFACTTRMSEIFVALSPITDDNGLDLARPTRYYWVSGLTSSRLFRLFTCQRADETTSTLSAKSQFWWVVSRKSVSNLRYWPSYSSENCNRQESLTTCVKRGGRSYRKTLPCQPSWRSFFSLRRRLHSGESKINSATLLSLSGTLLWAHVAQSQQRNPTKKQTPSKANIKPSNLESLHRATSGWRR